MGYCGFKMCAFPSPSAGIQLADHIDRYCVYFCIVGLLQRRLAQDHRQPWKLASTQNTIQPYSAHKYISLLLLLEHYSLSVIEF